MGVPNCGSLLKATRISSSGIYLMKYVLDLLAGRDRWRSTGYSLLLYVISAPEISQSVRYSYYGSWLLCPSTESVKFQILKSTDINVKYALLIPNIPRSIKIFAAELTCCSRVLKITDIYNALRTTRCCKTFIILTYVLDLLIIVEPSSVSMLLTCFSILYPLLVMCIAPKSWKNVK